MLLRVVGRAGTLWDPASAASTGFCACVVAGVVLPTPPHDWGGHGQQPVHDIEEDL